MNKLIKVTAILIGFGIFLAACSSVPEQVEVIRVVEVEAPGEDIEVEVTRIVEVEVEVT
jgi:starvation-inducible outer membrane lipoprotein